MKMVTRHVTILSARLLKGLVAENYHLQISVSSLQICITVSVSEFQLQQAKNLM